MRRFESKSRTKERKEIEDLARQPSSSTLETGAALTKFLSGKNYSIEDFSKCAQKLFENSPYRFETQFKIFENIKKFDEIFEIETTPSFFIFGKGAELWVVFCITRKNDEIVLLYKDSSGGDIPIKLQDKILDKIEKIKIITNRLREQGKGDEPLYGPLCLRNLKLLLELCQKDTNTLIDNFEKIEFCSPDSINLDKFNNVITLTNELSQNQEFKLKLKEFINKLPLDLGSDLLEYKRVMEAELEKDEEDVDVAKIQAARQRYMKEETILKFREDYKINENNLEGDAKDFELDIQKEYPEEMKKLGNIFDVLDNIKVDKQLFAALENISEILEIDYAKMRSFYEFKVKKEEQNQDDETLKPNDITEITKNLPPIKESTSTCTPLPQLLEEITLGMDPEDASSPKHSPEAIEDLTRSHHLVKNKYEIWKNSNLQTINDWAKKMKGHLGSNNEDICETIAIMDRTLNLLTGGHRLRDTQILAVLIFFYDCGSQGRLCQIKTGEGKTVIVSLLAVIRALQGYTVDVITSSPVLADDGVEETKTFYSIFNLTVSTNNVGAGTKNDFKIGYTADVLYGTISNFQFDFLKDTFEGFNIRRERKFGQVILDEVDSMLVDNGGHIAKLASPYPGMECFKYIYIKIWQELLNAEEYFVQETQTKIKEFLQTHSGDKNLEELYNLLLQEITKDERKIIKEKIRASNPTDIPLIPAHLKEYAKTKLEMWIKNALHAKYNCHEHQQYRIITNDAGEKIITPVDYLNTGVTLKNTIWSNGLHQFVQLKHNLHLTFESLTSSFISNIGYIRNYDDKLIFGLTGTLGSRAEQQLLSDIYNINYAKLPTYKQKKFEELPGLVVGDSSWHLQLSAEILEKIDEERAVLVICETEQDLLTIKKNLEVLQNNDTFRIRIFANEDNAGETSERVKIGDIILATNIAGRGTNFKTEKNLEEKGGLHVCVAFLPCNLRVEGQAFGRTSRQGNNGTAQLIIKQSEVDELGITNAKPSFQEIKQERDRLEKERLEEIKQVLVKELNFKDKLFSYFSDFHRNLKQEKSSKEYMFVLQDLKEFWAFWLEKKNFKGKNLGNTDPKKEFDNFTVSARGIIDGNIEHNPFYAVALAEHYLQKEDRNEAKRLLQHAIEMSPNNHDLLAGAHLKLFEIAIANGHQMIERFKKALANVFFFDPQKDERYKIEGLHHVKNAKIAITKELEYIEKYLSTNDPNFTKILKQDQVENPLLKHLYSRMYCLKVHDGNIDQLIQNIETFEGLDISGTAETTLENLDKMDRETKLSNFITEAELKELHSVGLDTIYSLKEIHDVDQTIIHAVQGQVLGGIAALVVGLCFLPVFPIMSSIGGTLISEGVMDLVMALISQGDSDFNEQEFTKGKFISYGISLITFGVSAITQSVKILSKAVSFCRKLASFLRKSKYLKYICNKLANLVDRIGDVLEGLLTTAKFNKLSKADQLDELTRLKDAGDINKFEKLGGLKKLQKLQKLKNANKLGELTRKQLLVTFLKETSLKTGQKVLKSIVEEHVVKPMMLQCFEELIKMIKNHFKSSLNEKIKENPGLVEKLRTASLEDIDCALGELSKSDEAAETAKNVGFKILDLIDNVIVNLLTLTYDTIKGITEVVKYVVHSASYLDKKLQNGGNDNNIDLVIDDICEKLSEKILAQLYDIIKGPTSFGKDIVVEKIGRYIQAKEQKEEFSRVLLMNPLEAGSTAEMRKALRIMNLNLCLGENRDAPEVKEELRRIHSAYEVIGRNNLDKIKRSETANF